MNRIVRCHILIFAFIAITAYQTHAQSPPEQTVGMSGTLKQIVIPGSRLVVKPFDTKTQVVVRIVGAWPHGTDWRYDFQYDGMEPGQYNLIEFLQREDGSSIDGIEPIMVDVRSLLPDGQVLPNELDTGLLPRLGGYRFVAAALVTIWFVVLGLIIFYRGKGKQDEDLKQRDLTLIDYLKPRLQAGIDGQLDRSQFAELERMIFAYWRERLGLQEMEAKDAMQQVKQHDTAGPMLTRLEQAMHDPRQVETIQLADILEPYRQVADVGQTQEPKPQA